MYSQNKEQGVINSLFPDTGRFLDVGAFDGKTFSNTLRLYERGWSGVLVEPSAPAFDGLSRLYQGSPRAVLINGLIGLESGTVDFYDSGGDAVSSTSPDHVEKWKKGYGSKFEKVRRRSITWSELFSKQGNDFQFVNLDTEGTNLQLLKAFPFHECLPLCMCIEHDSQIDQMMAILSPYGYRNLYTSGENIVVWNGPE